MVCSVGMLGGRTIFTGLDRTSVYPVFGGSRISILLLKARSRGYKGTRELVVGDTRRRERQELTCLLCVGLLYVDRPEGYENGVLS